MKKSFSMIELVLAIVIMSLSLLAIPVIITQSSAANAFALQQEAVLSSKMQMGLIFFTPWDSNDTNGNIINTQSKTIGLQNLVVIDEKTKKEKENPNTRANLPKNVFSDANATLPNSINSKIGLDNYHLYKVNMQTSEQERGDRGNRDMIFDINSTFKVSYISDELSKGSYIDSQTIEFEFNPNSTSTETSNIKQVEICTNLIGIGTDKADECDIVLRAFTTNLVRPQLLTRQIEL